MINYNLCTIEITILCPLCWSNNSKCRRKVNFDIKKSKIFYLKIDLYSPIKIKQQRKKKKELERKENKWQENKEIELERLYQKFIQVRHTTWPTPVLKSFLLRVLQKYVLIFLQDMPTNLLTTNKKFYIEWFPNKTELLICQTHESNWYFNPLISRIK